MYNNVFERSNYMNTTKREFVLLTDKFAKILFNTKVEQKYLTKLISLIIDTPVELLGQSFIPLNPHISVHPDVVSSEADLVYENGDIFVNLEINFHDSLKLINKKSSLFASINIKTSVF